MEWYGGMTIPLMIAVLQCIVVDAQTSVFDIACSFEYDLCGWTSVNLTRERYANVSGNNGTSGPRQAEDGLFYLNLDTSGKSPGETYIGSLNRDTLNVPAGPGDVCLRFWYHMFGETMGSLHVLVDDNVVWSKNGSQSDAWHCAAVDIAILQSKLSFEASMGYDIYTIIALDNIEVLNITCIQEDCENIYASTTVSHETPKSSTTPPMTPTLSLGTTTAAPTQINLDEYIPYIAGVPAGILIIGAVILIVCLKRQKLTKSPEPLMEIPTSYNRYGGFPHDPYSQINEAAEEVYTDIDFAMVSTGFLNTRNGDITNNQDGPRIMSSVNTRGEQVDVNNMHLASITSAGAEVDSNDYLVMTSTKGKKGSANLAFSLNTKYLNIDNSNSIEQTKDISKINELNIDNSNTIELKTDISKINELNIDNSNTIELKTDISKINELKTDNLKTFKGNFNAA